MSDKYIERDLRVSGYILDALNQATVHHKGVWSKSVSQDMYKFVCFYFKPECLDIQEVINKANGSSSDANDGYLVFKLDHHFKNEKCPDLESGAFTLKSLNQFGKFNKKTFVFKKDKTLNSSPVTVMLNTIIEGFSQEYSRITSRSAREQFFKALSNIFNPSKIKLASVSHNRLRAREKGGKEITVEAIDDTKSPKEASYEVTLSNLNGEEVENLLIFAVTQNKELDEASTDLARLEHAEKCLALALTRDAWCPLDIKMRSALIQASGDYSKVQVDEYLERDAANLSVNDYVNVAVSLLSSKYTTDKDIASFQNKLKRSLHILSE